MHNKLLFCWMLCIVSARETRSPKQSTRQVTYSVDPKSVYPGAPNGLINGPPLFNAPLYINGLGPENGQINGQIPFNGQVTPINGQIPTNGQVSVNGQIPINGQVPINGQPFYGQGPINVQDPANGQVLINGQAPINGQGPVNGQFLFNGQGPINVQEPSDGQVLVNGQAPINGQVPINGQAPFNGQVPINGQAPFNGQASFNGQVPFDGQLPINGLLTLNGQVPINGQVPNDGQVPTRRLISISLPPIVKWPKSVVKPAQVKTLPLVNALPSSSYYALRPATQNKYPTTTFTGNNRPVPVTVNNNVQNPNNYYQQYPQRFPNIIPFNTQGKNDNRQPFQQKLQPVPVLPNNFAAPPLSPYRRNKIAQYVSRYNEYPVTRKIPIPVAATPYELAQSQSRNEPKRLIPIPVIIDRPVKIRLVKDTVSNNPFSNNPSGIAPTTSPYSKYNVRLPVKYAANTPSPARFPSPGNYILPIATGRAQRLNPNLASVPNLYQKSKVQQNVASLVNLAQPSPTAPSIESATLSVPSSNVGNEAYARSIQYVTGIIRANSPNDPLVFVGTTPAPFVATSPSNRGSSTAVSHVNFNSANAKYSF